MNASATDSTTRLDQPAMDFESLRREGLELLQRMAGEAGTWTDFNAHDPGITILEQLCYALTDLDYRIDYDIEDLLASGESDPYRSLYGPAEILTTDAVTRTDIRRLVLDVKGVRNAWVEPVAAGESVSGGGEGRLNPNGLHRVMIAMADPDTALDNSKRQEIIQNVALRLHAHRNLCEDFDSIDIVYPQKIRVNARIEIRPVEQVDAVQKQICKIIADYIAPPIRFHSLEELLEQNVPFDQIFDGPLLEHGFLTADAVASASRREEIHTSDLIREIMKVEAVRTVQSITLDGKDWVLKLETDRVPTLDLNESSIELTRDDIPVAAPNLRTLALGSADKTVEEMPSIMPARGRNRNVGHYRSILHQFPTCYGVGESGLPLSAQPQRQAEVKQLKAYLMFFDQLLANSFSQLANANALFSFEPSTNPLQKCHTCFSQVIGAPGSEEERLGLDEIRVGDVHEHATRLQSITDQSFHDPAQHDSVPGLGDSRRSLYLDHLIARMGEQLTDYALVQRGLAGYWNDKAAKQAAGKVINDKQAFLREYPRISAARGSGFDCLRPLGNDNCSGLEQRIRRKLGLTEEERFCLVEHILLRPMEGDQQQEVPLLESAIGANPYSLQISFVFSENVGRFSDKPNDPFRIFVERTVAEETPAHLLIRIQWLESAAWIEFEKVYKDWFDKRRRYLKELLGMMDDNGLEV